MCVKTVCAAVIGLIADDSLHMTHLQAYLKKLGYSTHMVRARAEDLECDFGDQPQENSIMLVIRNRRYDADSSVISTATLASQWQAESFLITIVRRAWAWFPGTAVDSAVLKQRDCDAVFPL